MFLIDRFRQLPLSIQITWILAVALVILAAIPTLFGGITDPSRVTAGDSERQTRISSDANEDNDGEKRKLSRKERRRERLRRQDSQPWDNDRSTDDGGLGSDDTGDREDRRTDDPDNPRSLDDGDDNKDDNNNNN